MSKISLALLALLATAVIQKTAYATDVGGTCTGTWNPANNPFRFTSTCSVPTGQTLTILPGVVVNGQGGNTLLVDGTLVANGTAAQPIAFNEVQIGFQPGSGGMVKNNTFTSTFCCTQISITDASPTIMGNTFTDQHFFGVPAISVGGSSVVNRAQPLISGNIVTTSFGPSIVYSGTAAGMVKSNTIGFVAEASSDRVGIRVQGDASPRIELNTFTDDPQRSDTAIDLSISALSAVKVLNNTICVTGSDSPIRLGPDFFVDVMVAQVSGNTFGCGLGAGFGLGGTLAMNATLRAVQGQSSFVGFTTLSINVGARLSIPAGITLKQNSLTVSGTLQADGASFSDVQIGFQPSSGGMIKNSTFTSPFCCTQISITDASPTIMGNTFTTMGFFGVPAISVGGSAVANRAQPLISGNTITIPSGVGIDYSGTAAGTVTGNTFSFVAEVDSGRLGIQVSGDASPRIEMNTFNNDPQRADTAIGLSISALSTVKVLNNAICVTGGDIPLAIGPDFFVDTMVAQVSGNTFPCGFRGRVWTRGDAGHQCHVAHGAGAEQLRVVHHAVYQCGSAAEHPCGDNAHWAEPDPAYQRYTAG